MEKNSFIKIIIKDMRVHVRIGLHAHEQENGFTQDIIVNIALYAKADGYLDEPSRESIIDYDYIHSAIKAWADRAHVMLIETYLAELLDVCFEHPKVEAAKISITKPDIFDDVEQVGVETYMTRDDWDA